MDRADAVFVRLAEYRRMGFGNPAWPDGLGRLAVGRHPDDPYAEVVDAPRPARRLGTRLFWVFRTPVGRQHALLHADLPVPGAAGCLDHGRTAPAGAAVVRSAPGDETAPGSDRRSGG